MVNMNYRQNCCYDINIVLWSLWIWKLRWQLHSKYDLLRQIYNIVHLEVIIFIYEFVTSSVLAQAYDRIIKTRDDS